MNKMCRKDELPLSSSLFLSLSVNNYTFAQQVLSLKNFLCNRYPAVCITLILRYKLVVVKYLKNLDF